MNKCAEEIKVNMEKKVTDLSQKVKDLETKNFDLGQSNNRLQIQNHHFMSKIENSKNKNYKSDNSILKLFRENQCFNLLKRDKAASLLKIPNDYFIPAILTLNNPDVLLV